MITIYIKGINKYKAKVRKALRKSILVEGDHYIEGHSSHEDCTLYWLTSRITLLDFKKSIGAKYVWKYRLRFYKTIEEMNPKTIEGNFKYTPRESELMEKYRIYE